MAVAAELALRPGGECAQRTLRRRMAQKRLLPHPRHQHRQPHRGRHGQDTPHGISHTPPEPRVSRGRALTRIPPREFGLRAGKARHTRLADWRRTLADEAQIPRGVCGRGRQPAQGHHPADARQGDARRGRYPARRRLSAPLRESRPQHPARQLAPAHPSGPSAARGASERALPQPQQGRHRRREQMPPRRQSDGHARDAKPSGAAALPGPLLQRVPLQQPAAPLPRGRSPQHHAGVAQGDQRAARLGHRLPQADGERTQAAGQKSQDTHLPRPSRLHDLQREMGRKSLLAAAGTPHGDHHGERRRTHRRKGELRRIGTAAIHLRAARRGGLPAGSTGNIQQKNIELCTNKS